MESNIKISIMRNRAFTLIELLVVIAIIGILVGITLPAVQMVRESARRTQCLNKVRQIGLAALNYESSHRSLPSGVAPSGFRSWLQPLMPFLEQTSIHSQATQDYRLEPSPFSGHAGMQTVIPILHCPSEPGSDEVHWTHGDRLVASTSYLGVCGTDFEEKDGMFFFHSKIRLGDIRDGSSNTLMIGERPPSPDFWYGWWYAGLGQDGAGSCDAFLGVRERKSPVIAGTETYLEDCPEGPYQFSAGKTDRQCDTLHFWSHHPGGANFVLADGSSRFFAYEGNEVFPALATRNGQETVELPY